MRRQSSCEVVRLLAGVAILSAGCIAGAVPCLAAIDEWGGSVALASDYLVRGISRTSNQAALQLDLHYANPDGFIAGAFASNSRIDPGDPVDVELSAFIGYAWNVAADWRAKITASHYAYPWNQEGSNYNYDELDFDAAYRGWLHFGLNYSPNSPRYVASAPYQRLIAVTEKAAEVNAQRPIVGRLSATAGIGYSTLSGPESGGYTYWSVGAAYDWRSLTLAASYVNTSSEAKALFYNAAAAGRFTGTVIWRF
ncbi:MAG TPA: TorF family putative porin [Steroidobacteraceae bacterium]